MNQNSLTDVFVNPAMAGNKGSTETLDDPFMKMVFEIPAQCQDPVNVSHNFNDNMPHQN